MTTRNYAVQTKVRPYAEIVEVSSSRGLQTAVIVYGNTKDEAGARAALLKEYMTLEATPAYIRDRLKKIVRLRWAWKMHKQCRKRFNIYTLIVWTMQCWLDPQQVGVWLAENFDVEVPVLDGGGVARILPEEDIDG